MKEQNCFHEQSDYKALGLPIGQFVRDEGLKMDVGDARGAIGKAGHTHVHLSIAVEALFSIGEVREQAGLPGWRIRGTNDGFQL